jgi:hypothetical protein
MQIRKTADKEEGFERTGLAYMVSENVRRQSGAVFSKSFQIQEFS